MAVYDYRALNKGGREISGSADAESVRSLRQKLKAQGLFPIEVREGRTNSGLGDLKALLSGSKRLNFNLSEAISAKSLSFLTRQLATLLNAGIPLVEAFGALADQLEQPQLKRLIVSIRGSVQEGSSLARALQNFPKAFPPLYINMISSGEASGGLEAVLNNLADYLEAQLAMQRKIISALVYPALLLTFCTLIVLYLFTNVVPTIVEVFVKQGRPLPLPTQITMAISNAIINYWYLIIFSIGGTILFISWYLNTKNGKAVFDTFMIKAPAIGITYKKIATARVAKTLSALLGSGVGLLEALDIARNIMSNSHLRKALEEAQEGVREGKSLARELSRSGLFPIMLSQMVAVGERSGSLEPMLERASRTYETEVNISLDGLTALIQPVMIIGLGGIVLGIVMSVMMPMMDLMQIVQG